MKKSNLVVILLIALGLTACGAGQTLIKKRNLDVQTKMSATLFLEPVAQSKRKIYVTIRNTSDQELHIESSIKDTLTNKGYVLVQDPDSASFMLQANVISIGKSDLRGAEDALSGGFGGALTGKILSEGDSSATIVGGILGFIGDALVTDVVYQMVTDIQIRERPLSGENIVQQQRTDISQGTGTGVSQKTTDAKINWKTYRTRVVSTANKVNLKFEEAQSDLENGLIRSISGIF